MYVREFASLGLNAYMVHMVALGGVPIMECVCCCGQLQETVASPTSIAACSLLVQEEQRQGEGKDSHITLCS